MHELFNAYQYRGGFWQDGLQDLFATYAAGLRAESQAAHPAHLSAVRAAGLTALARALSLLGLSAHPVTQSGG
jgi:hypothetical protein